MLKLIKGRRITKQDTLNIQEILSEKNQKNLKMKTEWKIFVLEDKDIILLLINTSFSSLFFGFVPERPIYGKTFFTNGSVIIGLRHHILTIHTLDLKLSIHDDQ